MTEQPHAPATEHDDTETAADDATPTLAELNARHEALNARITDHFNRLRGQ
ncbi:hypothetical protein [Streptomyces aidingensis]|uniref:Uncharacterized protein n=1 Tax=Streptomyces aidingensis TaxID=910347 RepID=A0A1I1GM45_9ACTN|nr:hypothetical protein [Streptomyces aidingensis]SFC12332.1 hypothetical protein SAMN05421773_10242 [Streptomyces aidingensis]